MDKKTMVIEYLEEEIIRYSIALTNKDYINIMEKMLWQTKIQAFQVALACI